MKRAIITGGSGGIGQAIVTCFQANDYSVIAPVHNELDLCDPDTIDQFFQKYEPDFDVFIHSAGINNPQAFIDLDDDNLHKTIQVNTLSFLQMCKHILPGMKHRNGGHVLAVSSVYGIISRACRLPYSLSKHALSGIIQPLAIEYGPYNVLVNGLAPGFVATPLTYKNNSPDKICRLESGIPLGRMAKPEEIAQIAFFLCSSQNHYITGQTVVADGGYLAGGFQDA